MKGKEQQQVDERHRNLKTPIWAVFDHEVGPYRCILAGFKPMEWRAKDIPLDVLKEDVENQLTLLLAGEEYLKAHGIRKPLYGDVIHSLKEITQYRDEDKEGFMTKLGEKIQELFPKKRQSL